MDSEQKLRLAAFIKSARGSISQRRFALKCGVSYYALNQWELGAAMPSSENMRKLAIACETTTDAIWEAIGGTSEESVQKSYKQAEDVATLTGQLSLLEKIRLIKLISEDVERSLKQDS